MVQYIICELIHLKTGNIYFYNEEVIENSNLWIIFQESENPELLGFVYVDTLENRLNTLRQNAVDNTI